MSRMKHLVTPLIMILMVCASPAARGQTELQRFDRELEQSRRQITTPPSNAPPENRALIDYGAYASFNYLSLDDPNLKRHGLRQYDLYPYARLMLEGQELYLRGRLGYRDFNSGESFDGRGDEPIDPDLDRGFYRFDLRAWELAQAHREIGYNVILEGGRDLAY